ncbi:hypothetical protein R0131_17985 [Clostridium sp. AL.422]|uniref:hypothetical protein n=1 Tax=Clostridium TaxID=1485 RepID=UPI00293DC069|nr:MULTISPECIES: hypothetical protein [unclassified Clostridium]MDV4152722.1 hypothetical protein [Clostridium sp. AL.422]
MQNTVERKTVGAGIITMSILDFLGQVIVILGCLINIFGADFMNSYYENMGLVNPSAEINIAEIFITLAISVIITVSVILILAKKPIGAYMFIGIEVLSLIYRVITSGISIFTPLGLIFPALMIFFIYKKKDIYFVKE